MVTAIFHEVSFIFSLMIVCLPGRSYLSGPLRTVSMHTIECHSREQGREPCLDANRSRTKASCIGESWSWPYYPPDKTWHCCHRLTAFHEY
ncbi:hypothetical protein F5Y15DRAFT_112150 [Xylariaceae sp. FL0016]|nr:hypothetical protein F5Y15DRAFT_112150 [Xylariaceae sp. FL0016]